MNIRFLTPTWHGLVDYLAAVELLIMPFVLRLGTSAPFAKWLAVATGLAVILVSLLTDYKLGLVRIIPFRLHLAIDTAVATAFVVARSCSASPDLMPGSTGSTRPPCSWSWQRACRLKKGQPRHWH